MTFILHSDAENFFNANAYKLIDLVETIPIDDDAVPFPAQDGSIAHKIAMDWSDKVTNAPMRISNTVNEVAVDIYEIYDYGHVGLNEENYKTLKKLVTGLYNIKSVSNKVTYEFLYDQTFKWVLQAYKSKKCDNDYISFIKDEISKVTGDFKYFFKVLNLDIEKKFRLGQVDFEYLEREYFDAIKEKYPERDVDALREKFQGNVYTSVTLKNIQRDRGLDFALIECCNAMNVLKLFCKTVYFPQIRTTYDIDRRVTISEAYEYIIQKSDDAFDFKINLLAGSRPYPLEEDTINSVILFSKNFVNLIENKEPNELQKVLLNALEKFSEAISNKDIHRRIVDLFTIWESLLLKNDSVNIQDSLIFYGANFIGIKSEEREDFISFIMSMYDIRSQMVHHANRKKLDFEKISKLQRNTVELMETFIVQSAKFGTKQLLLNDLENHLKTTVENYSKLRKDKPA